ITKDDYHKLRADDDYLQKMGGKADPNNWRESLSYFGQVAFVGSIPPSQISLHRELKRKGYLPKGVEEIPVESVGPTYPTIQWIKSSLRMNSQAPRRVDVLAAYIVGS